MANKKTKVLIVQHDGSKYQTEVQDYDAQVLNDQLNDTGRNTIAIGDLILTPGLIARVIPVKE